LDRQILAHPVFLEPIPLSMVDVAQSQEDSMADEIKIGMPIPLGIIEHSDAPLVDEALAQPKADMAGTVADQLAALKAEVSRISDSMSEMTGNARNTIKTKANAAEAVVEETLRLHPVLSVLTAAGVGYGLALLLHHDRSR
jgi:ElaB/YqjD/DUF883 family membrane-anchored ribosome-binding protein